MPFPNKDTQIKPGEVRNPRGNYDRHSTKTIDSWINEMLNDPEFTMKIIEEGQITEYKGAPIKAIIRAQLRLALQHTDPQVKARSADLLMKYGSVKKVQLGNDPDNPLPETKLIDSDMLAQFMLMMKNDTKQ